MKSLISKILVAFGAEPAISIGGLAGVISAIVVWIQTNEITTLKQLITLASPFVVSFVIRTFVTPKSKVALTHEDVAALSRDARMKALGANTGPLPTPPASNV